MPVNPELVLTTLQDLIRIDSRNPASEDGAPGEWELAVHVENLLEQLGWPATLHDLGDRRANVVARRKGTGRGPALMLNVHLDTVGVAGMEDPFSGRRRDGRIWGRGAQDTKGGMAAVLGAAKALSDDSVDLKGDVVLAFVADEEHQSRGTTALLEHVRTDAAIVLEPSDLDVCTAHRGFGVFRLRTQGRKAHGGQSSLGIDANLHMGRVLVELDRLRTRWGAHHRHPVLGAATLHVPRISGGRQLFVYADECTVDLECRTVPGLSHTEVLEELEALVTTLEDRLTDFRGSVESSLWRAPYEIDPARPIVQTVLTAARAVRHEPVRTIGHPWWEDSGLLGDAGIDAVVLGPKGHGLHTDEEWVDAESVVALGEILYRSIRTYCG